MKLGDVLKKERKRRSFSVEEVASGLGISVEEYRELEGGVSEAEEWGPRLGEIAVRLKIPTSRLISETGSSSDSAKVPGQCGNLVRLTREKTDMTREDLAKSLGLRSADVETIENGESPIETCGPLLLRFAELVELPIFNLFYPCGLPLDELDDYP
jgi:transcriptional regulator with XRE-family HTH domain